jgi:predicted nucleotidyltransferase
MADGWVDLLIGNADAPNQLFRNLHGSGVFESVVCSVTRFSYATSAVAFGDFDNDGDLDVIAVSTGRNFYPTFDELHRNDGNGTWTFVEDAGSLSSASYFSKDVAVVDYDADGDLDVLVVGQATRPRLHRNDGYGRFSLAENLGSLSDNNPANPRMDDITITWGDLDGDGLIDVILGSSAQQGRTLFPGNGVVPTVHMNMGGGTYTRAVTSSVPSNSGRTRATLVGDLDNECVSRIANSRSQLTSAMPTLCAVSARPFTSRAVVAQW